VNVGPVEIKVKKKEPSIPSATQYMKTFLNHDREKMTPGSNDIIGPFEFFAGPRNNAFPLTQKLRIKSSLMDLKDF